MMNNGGKPYEFISKLLLIAFSFLAVSFVFGYHWMILKNHSLNTSGMVVNAIETFNKYPCEDAEGRIRKFKDITGILAAGERSFLIVDEKEKPVFFSYLPVQDDPVSSLEIFKSNNISPVVFSNGYSERRLYYIPDDLTGKMKYYPFLLIGSIILTVFITWYMYMFMRRNEKQSIWIAMSKETAHQLGTPLTSLKGWRQYLAEISKDNESLNALEEGLKDDIERISIIVDRFSKISSDHDFTMCDLKSILNKSADYISKRVTVDPEKISIIKELNDVPGIYANPVLIEWTVENLLKNAIESLKNERKGIILLKMFEEKKKIIIEIRDNGTGISPSIRKNVFDTGFTTKKRGWGLGLSLARKVVEQYHNGSLFIKETGPEGSVFRIELNKFI
jgi:two-component system, sporulation sensor kinase D